MLHEVIIVDDRLKHTGVEQGIVLEVRSLFRREVGVDPRNVLVDKCLESRRVTRVWQFRIVRSSQTIHMIVNGAHSDTTCGEVQNHGPIAVLFHPLHHAIAGFVTLELDRTSLDLETTRVAQDGGVTLVTSGNHVSPVGATGALCGLTSRIQGAREIEQSGVLVQKVQCLTRYWGFTLGIFIDDVPGVHLRNSRCESRVVAIPVFVIDSGH